MTPDIPAHILESCERSGATAWQNMVDGCATVYDRIRHLPRMLPVTDDELKDFSAKGTTAIITRLEAIAKNIAASRQQGHWATGHHEHATVLGALKAERRMLLETLQTEGLANIFASAAE